MQTTKINRSYRSYLIAGNRRNTYEVMLGILGEIDTLEPKRLPCFEFIFEVVMQIISWFEASEWHKEVGNAQRRVLNLTPWSLDKLMMQMVPGYNQAREMNILHFEELIDKLYTGMTQDIPAPFKPTDYFLNKESIEYNIYQPIKFCFLEH